MMHHRRLTQRLLQAASRRSSPTSTRWISATCFMSKQYDNNNNNTYSRSHLDFNLLRDVSGGNESVESNAKEPKLPRKHRPEQYQPFRPKDKNWWRQMDRVSFRKLLEECMATGRVSSVLRKYIAEYPILETQWSDQDLVLLIGALIKMNDSERAMKILQNQIREPNLNRINRVMSESARLGNVKVALRALEIAKYFKMNPDVITYTSAIHACARGKRDDIHIALKLFNEMLQSDVLPNHRTYGAIVLAYARLQRWNDIQELVESIPYANVEEKADVYASAITTCSRNRQYACATKLFIMLLDGGIYPGDKVCNAAISACARTSDLENLSMIFKLVETHAAPTRYTYNSMISAYGNARDMDGAIRILEQMKLRGVQPDVISYNSLMMAAVRSRNADYAFEALQMMKDEKLTWDCCTVNTLLQACVCNRDTAKAEELIEEANKDTAVRLNRTSFETFMEVYYNAEDYTGVINLWKHNYTCRRRAKSSKALNILLQACGKLADATKAEELVTEFTERGLELSSVSHNHLLSTYIASGEAEKAIGHLHRMKSQGARVTTFSYTCIMNHLYQRGKASELLELFDDYLKERKKGLHVNSLLHYPSDAIYVLAASACLQIGDSHRAIKIYHECPKPTSLEVKKELAKIAVSVCEKAEDWKGAVLLYDSINSALDTDTDVAIYETVVRIVARAGEFEKALDVNGGDWYRSNRTDKGWF